MKSNLSLERALGVIWSSPTDDFVTLVKAVGLDPKVDFIGADLRDMVFRNQDLTQFDFSKADFRGSDISGTIFDESKLADAIFDSASDPRRWLESDEILSQLRKIIGVLSEAPDAPDWHEQWLRAWQTFGRHPRLGELASWWLGRTNPSHAGFAAILAIILRRTRAANDIKDIAITWLLNNDVRQPYWPAIWRRLGRTKVVDTVLSNKYINIIENCDPCLNEAMPINTWIDVWQLSVSGEMIQEAHLDIAFNIFARLERKGKFLHRVILFNPTADSRSKAIALAEAWIMENHSVEESGVKVRIFKDLVSLSPPGPAIVRSMLSWVLSNADLYNVLSVWPALSKRLRDDVRLIELSKIWLDETEADNLLWGRVFATVYDGKKDEIPKSLLQKGLGWLKTFGWQGGVGDRIAETLRSA